MKQSLFVLFHSVSVFSCSEKGWRTRGGTSSWFLLCEGATVGLETYPVAWPLEGWQPYSHGLGPKPWDDVAHPSLAQWTEQAPTALGVVSFAFIGPNIV